MRILPYIAALLLFLLFCRLLKRYPEALVLKAYEEFTGLLRAGQKESNWYQKTQQRLCRKGASFHFGSFMSPTWFLFFKLVPSLVTLLVLSGVSAGYGLLGMVLCFFLPDMLLLHMNNRDNISLLPEIKLVYHALEIQIRAGVYVTDALTECYGSVQNRRLRQALLDLAGDIVMKADIYQALDGFQKKFDNRYIDSLCITILQALESGHAVELLADISEQVKDMEQMVLERKKAALDRSITFYQLGVLAVVLGIVLYACVTHMFSAAVQM